MQDENKPEDIKIITIRPNDQKREFSNYIEFASNPNEVSLKFCDVKPPLPEELEKIKKEKKVEIPVNTEIIIPFVVAEAFSKVLEAKLKEIREKIDKGEIK